MAAQPYSAKVMDHFMNPRNVGAIERADGVGEVGNPATGNMMRLYLQVRDGTILDARFRTFGCGVAIAASSMLTEMIKTKTLGEAQVITSRQVSDALDGIPPEKLHCAAMAQQVLRAALDDYGRTHPPRA